MINRLNERIKELQAPVVVGIDLTLKLMPDYLLEGAIKQYGANNQAAASVLTFCGKAIIDEIYDIVPAVKIQVAMYEQYGMPGMETYYELTSYAKSKGLIVMGDIKRGDIGSTSESYAIGHLGSNRIGTEEVKGFDSDIITVNPYLGSDGVVPFIDVAREHKKGLFILVKTSNPSSGEFQDVKCGDKPLFQLVAEKVDEWGQTYMGEQYSNVGAVTGATYPTEAILLRKIMPKTFFLVPGYGAQGGKAADLKPFFNEDGTGAIVNNSRGIVAAYSHERYKDTFAPSEFAQAARQATIDMIEDLRTIF